MGDERDRNTDSGHLPGAKPRDRASAMADIDPAFTRPACDPQWAGVDDGDADDYSAGSAD
jgi:hypothetical protein